MWRFWELLAFSYMILCNRSLITMAVVVAGSGLPVGSPPYILAHSGTSWHNRICQFKRVGRRGAYRDCRTALEDRKLAAVPHLGYTKNLNSFSSCSLDCLMSSLRKASIPLLASFWSAVFSRLTASVRISVLLPFHFRCGLHWDVIVAIGHRHVHQRLCC